ncbi:DUF4129 domain-containing protein [Lysobacter humi (ex Lee et al. 2017)]
MRIDALTVVLRPRSAWEAVELGTALVRRHARAVWRAWLALAVPVFVLVNAAAWALDLLWLAPLLMWWLKPAFDRVPLFVLSRAVFGEVPDVRTTLRGAFRDGRRSLWGYLLWRRLTPARALLMPVDMLEGGDPATAGARRAAVAGPAYGVAALTLVVFVHFEAALALATALLAFLFVPPEYMQSSMQMLWRHLQDAPAWLALLQNALMFAATCVLEPFYVGTGFGQYLNRRTEIEGWDIELAFRRMAQRLTSGAAGALLLVACLLPLAARAQAEVDAPPRAAAPRCPLPVGDTTTESKTIAQIFGDERRPEKPLIDAAERAYKDPRLTPKRKVGTWERRHPKKDEPEKNSRMPEWLRALLGGVATAGELLLWALGGALVLLLLLTARRWWPWLRALGTPPPAAPKAIVEREAVADAPLPDDIVAAARRLYADGRPRDALGLLYRASVEAMLATTGRPLPPGATEAQCLRAAAALPADMRDAFARVVRLWQHAAYADRMPDADAFDALIAAAAPRFGWRA